MPLRVIAGDSLYRDTVCRNRPCRGQWRCVSALAARASRSTPAAAAFFDEDRSCGAARHGGGARTARLRQAARSRFVRRSILARLRTCAVTTTAIAGPRRTCVRRRTPTATSRGRAVAWFLGLIAFAQGRLADAQANYEDTLATFERMGDAEQVAAAHPLLAALYFYLGDPTNEWSHRTAALQGLSISRSPDFKYGLMATAAMSVRAQSPETALAMQDAALSRTPANADASRPSSRSLLNAASTLMTSRRTLRSWTRLGRSARTLLGHLKDESFRRLVELSVLASRERLCAPQSGAAAQLPPARSKPSIERGDRTRLPQFYLRLAKANIVWGTPDGRGRPGQGHPGLRRTARVAGR